MSTVLLGEQSVPLSLGIPLAAPSAEAALDFLRAIIPPTVFSSGEGRRRRCGEELRPAGRRSDQGYLVFYRRSQLDAAPRMTALKSPSSIWRYLQEQMTAPPADHWVSLQLTQYRAGRDGRPPRDGYTAETGRHLLAIVLDLDGSRMAPELLHLLREDPWAFRAAVEELLDQVGVIRYTLVRSGPAGAQLHIPLARSDGRPFRASQENLTRWELAARGLCRLFADFGADPNAVRPTQPFVLPGLPRLKHPGFIPYVYASRPGPRTNLFMLIRRLAELKMLHRAKGVEPTKTLSPDRAFAQDVEHLLREIREAAAGVALGSRNTVAHGIAVMLLAKGAPPERIREALIAWNRRNTPALSLRELESCLRSAMRCRERYPDKWAEMARAAWNDLRATLGLPGVLAGYRRNGRWRPLTPAKPWLVRKLTGGREHYEEVAERLLRFVAGEGGRVEMTQQTIADVIDASRTTLKVVLKRLEASGRLIVATRRGRGGKTVLTLPDAVSPITASSVENGQSGISSFAAKKGARVGRAPGREDGAITCALPAESEVAGVSAGGPVAALADLCRRRFGVDVGSCQPVPVLAVVAGAGACRLVACTQLGRGLLHGLVDLGELAQLERRLGYRVLVELGPGLRGDGPGDLPRPP